MKNILKIILCVLVCYIAIGLGWITKDIIIHENGKDGIAILGYHGVVSEQEKKENYASNPYFMSISEFEKQMKNYIDEVVVKLAERLDEYIVSIECNRENSFSEMYGSSAYVEEFKDILINLMNSKLGEVKDLSVRDLIYNS